MYETENQKFMIAFARMHMRHCVNHLADSIAKMVIITDVCVKMDESYLDVELFTPLLAYNTITDIRITY